MTILRFRSIIAGVALLFVVSVRSQAAVFNVGCDTEELIAAIDTANGNGEADTLNLTAGCVYSFTDGDAANNDSALPRITSEITINGNGATIERSSAAPTEFRLLYMESSNVTLNNLTLRGGKNPDGGAILIYSGALTVTSSTISGNSANFGGGILLGSGALTVTSSTISGNSANFGGGIYSTGAGTTTVTNSTISGNSSSVNGGGIYKTNLGMLTVTSSTISGNSANGDGGGILSIGISTVTNSTISGNSANGSGGGVLYSGNGTVEMTNSTISGNSANFGGGIFYTGGTFGTLKVTNSIVWGNSSSQLINDSGTVSVTFSIVQGGFGGTGNLDADPMFVAPVSFASAPTTDGDYHLRASSPAIDAGNNADIPPGITTDRDGGPRIVNGTVDMGAYESPLHTELLANGGFEDGITGWMVENASGDKRKCNKPNKTVSYAGDCAFAFKGSASENVKLTQEVDLSGVTLTQGDILNLSAFFDGSNPTLSAELILSVSYAGEPEAVELNVSVPPNVGYAEVALPTLTIESGTVSGIKVTLKHKSAGGSKLNMDDVSLTLSRTSVRALPLPPPPAPDGMRSFN
jgi:hypothetical protein